MKLCIIDPHSIKNKFKLDENSLELGLGGTETWDIQFSRHLAILGNEVFLSVFCNTHKDKYGVNWISLDDLKTTLLNNHFEAILIIRYFKGIINLIEQNNITDKVFIQATQTSFEDYCARPILYESCKEFQSNIIKKFFYLSEFNKKTLMNLNHIPEEKLDYLPVGIDIDLFKNISIDNNVDHRILMASSNRGIMQMIPTILNLVKKEIPDFGFDIASPAYDNYAVRNSISPDIKFFGHLSKTRLYEEFSKHACWIYPSIFPETFCLVSVEAAMCGNELILPLINGPATTFKPFQHSIGMKNKFYSPEAFYECSKRIVKSMKNYHNKENVFLRKQIREYISNNFSINILSKKFLDYINSI